MRGATKAWLAGLIATSLCLALVSAALAEDVAVAEAVADEKGTGALCIAADKAKSEDEIVELIQTKVKIDAQVQSISVVNHLAKVAFRTEPARRVTAQAPAEVVADKGLHRCAAAEKKRKTRVCAIEDNTRVESPDNPTTSRTLTPGYCVDCWEGLGCGEPFLAAGLLGLLGGPATSAAAAAAVTGGVLGGLAGTGALGGGGGGGKASPTPAGVPTPPTPPTPPPIVVPTEIPLPQPSATSPPVSPSQ
jgi:hypothetical protein